MQHVDPTTYGMGLKRTLDELSEFDFGSEGDSDATQRPDSVDYSYPARVASLDYQDYSRPYGVEHSKQGNFVPGRCSASTSKPAPLHALPEAIPPCDASTGVQTALTDMLQVLLKTIPLDQIYLSGIPAKFQAIFQVSSHTRQPRICMGQIELPLTTRCTLVGLRAPLPPQASDSDAQQQIDYGMRVAQLEFSKTEERLRARIAVLETANQQLTETVKQKDADLASFQDMAKALTNVIQFSNSSNLQQRPCAGMPLAPPSAPTPSALGIGPASALSPAPPSAIAGGSPTLALLSSRVESTEAFAITLGEKLTIAPGGAREVAERLKGNVRNATDEDSADIMDIMARDLPRDQGVAERYLRRLEGLYEESSAVDKFLSVFVFDKLADTDEFPMDNPEQSFESSCHDRDIFPPLDDGGMYG